MAVLRGAQVQSKKQNTDNFRCIDVDSINLTKLRSLRFETNLCSFRVLFMISRRSLFRLSQLLDVRSKTG